MQEIISPCLNSPQICYIWIVRSQNNPLLWNRYISLIRGKEQIFILSVHFAIPIKLHFVIKSWDHSFCFSECGIHERFALYDKYIYIHIIYIHIIQSQYEYNHIFWERFVHSELHMLVSSDTFSFRLPPLSYKLFYQDLNLNLNVHLLKCFDQDLSREFYIWQNCIWNPKGTVSFKCLLAPTQSPTTFL